MKILKLILAEEDLLWDWEKEPFRKQKDIYNMEWELLYSIDPFDKEIDIKIKNLFI